MASRGKEGKGNGSTKLCPMEMLDYNTPIYE